MPKATWESIAFPLGSIAIKTHPEFMKLLEECGWDDYTFNVSGTTSVGALQLNWTRHDDELIGDFRVYLKKLRDKFVPIKETRRSGGTARKLRKELKDLAAWRLCEWIGWEEAYLFTTEQMGRGLFSNHASKWRSATRAAENVFATLRFMYERLNRQ